MKTITKRTTSYPHPFTTVKFTFAVLEREREREREIPLLIPLAPRPGEVLTARPLTCAPNSTKIRLPPLTAPPSGGDCDPRHHLEPRG